MNPSGGRYPAIMDLPHSVQRRLAGILDGSAVHNWKALVAAVSEYTDVDARQFSTEEQQGRSPSMAVLADLDSHGWSIVDLAQLAHAAHLGIVVDTIREHCKKRGLALPLPPPCSLHSAKTCYDRPASPPPPTPPTTPTAHREALVRYNSASTPGTPTPPLCTEGGACALFPAEETMVTAGSQPHPLAPAAPAISIPYETLHMATGGFSPLAHSQGGHKLGEGGSGEVFHCELSLEGGRPQDVAVKVFRSEADRGSLGFNHRQFQTEIHTLCMLSHAHLLPLLGYSCDGPRRCLVYPFLPQGSLDRHISHCSPLSTARRLWVACHVASALHYLHTGCSQVLVHRDVKSANVLLREDWGAVLGDYGVVRVQPSSGTAVTTTVAGTPVYMAPEYTRGGTVTVKNDVYSFGVVLFELLLGVSAHDPVPCYHGDTEGTDLVSFVEEFEGQISSVLIGQWQDDVGQGVWSLAECCIHDNRHTRPSSTEVYQKLLALSSLHSPPSEQPAPSSLPEPHTACQGLLHHNNDLV